MENTIVGQWCVREMKSRTDEGALWLLEPDWSIPVCDCVCWQAPTALLLLLLLLLMLLLLRLRNNGRFPAPNLPAFYDMYRAQTPNGEFSDGRMSEQSISLSDNRRVHGGQVHWTQPKKTYKLRKTSGNVEDYLTAFMTRLKFARSKNYQQSGEKPVIADEFTKGNCETCGVLSNAYCNRCSKVFYCSLRCQASHWAEHRLVCRTPEAQGLGRPAAENMQSRPSPKKTSPPNYNQKEQQCDTESNASNTSSGSRKTVVDNNDRKSDSSERSSYSENNNNAWKTHPETTPASASTKAQQPSKSKVEITATTAVESKVHEKKRVVAGMVKNVFVASADSSTAFWVILQDDEPGLDDLGNELNKRINDSSPGLKSAVVGEWCCKKYDGNWTRARIVTAAPLTIIYVDYGNMEPATLDQLKMLPADLAAQLPPFAINVCLGNGLSPADAQTEFPLRFLSEDGSEKWPVEKVYDNGYKSIELAPDVENLEIQLSAILSATCIFATVSETEQVKMEKIKFVQMIYEMQEIAENLPLLKNPKEKQVCCSKCSDGIWYRGEILQVMNGVCKLRFVDYGDYDTVESNEIHEIKPEWLEIPVQGLHMNLYNLRIAPDTSVKDCEAAVGRLFDQTVIAKIKNRNPLHVELYTEDGKSVNEDLLATPFFVEEFH
ncbi:hypothetical protein LSTR_LSTR006634 [Laodelphax striatellus]|uniref:Tudor domain-containing protein 1 n=1 Tax=Laodelphax striatellus TaxID=195883 RepID=A0A482X9R2_LAOST|nr:hypothetical protein LSTR_LSTR006634 [Laodelphax striatellus]